MDNSPFKQGFRFGLGYIAARFVAGSFLIAAVLAFIIILGRFA